MTPLTAEETQMYERILSVGTMEMMFEFGCSIGGIRTLEKQKKFIEEYEVKL